MSYRLARDGIDAGTIVETLRGCMKASTGPRDDRWRARFDSIPGLVESALKKVQGEAGKLDPFVAAVAELTEMPAHEYDRIRKAKADELGVRTSTLDQAVEKARRGADTLAPVKGSALTFPEVEPWPEPVNGADVLDEVVVGLKRYVVFQNEHQRRAVALWCAHAYCMDFCEVAPRLVITSPTMNCGKSVLLAIVGRLVPRPLLASNVSPASVFRVLEAARPTMLIDEADSFVTGDTDELRGILNSGHTRSSAYVVRAVEVNGEHEPRIFSTWGALALAGIGKLPGTILSRAIIVEMQRAQASERPERYIARKASQLDNIARKIARFVQDSRRHLENADPEVPEALTNRSYDNWVELIAVGDAAGAHWPEFARDAALKLNAPTEEEARGILLLAHIRELFGDQTYMHSDDLTAALTAREEWPWADDSRGKPLTKVRLARMLKAFRIYPGSVGLSGNKGYKREALEPAWNRYLPSLSEAGGIRNAETPNARRTAGYSDFQNAEADSGPAFSNPPSAKHTAGFGVSAFQKGGDPEEGYDPNEEDVL